jgi:hypothetical protein
VGSKGENSEVMRKNVCGKIHKEWGSKKEKQGVCHSITLPIFEAQFSS